jgi:hypothetical protein
MVTTVTLIYTVNVQTPISQANLLTAIAAVPLNKQPLLQYGATPGSDTSAAVGTTQVARTVDFNLSAQFTAMFPTGTDQASAFRNFFTPAIAAALNSQVVASEPDFT